MIFSVDFDGVVVSQARSYDDLTSPLEFIPGAYEGLKTLKQAGHIIIVSSPRANLALRKDWRLNPLWVNGVIPFNVERWESNRSLNEARYEQMVQFCDTHLLGIIDAVDDGQQGKLMFIDVSIGEPGLDFEFGWRHIADLYGSSAISETRKVRKKV